MFERATITATVGGSDGWTAGEAATSPSTGSGFAPPDLVWTDLNSSAANSGFTVGGNIPSGIYTAPNDGYGNTRCMRVTIPVTLDGGSISEAHGLSWTERTSVHVCSMVRIHPNEYPTGDFNIKGIRFHNALIGNCSELYGNFTWAHDWDGDQANLDLGMYLGVQPSAQATYGVVPYLENLADGAEHWLEIFYDRNVAGGFVEVSFWADGTPIVQPVGPCFSSFYGPSFQHPFSNWIGGSAGVTPSRIRTARSATAGTLLGDCTWNETISQNPDRIVIYQWDHMAASSARIGPEWVAA